MLKRFLALALTATLLAGSSPAQMSVFPDRSYWREIFQSAPYNMEIESVSQLDGYLVNDRLELSLQAYLELVMANSPNINLQKLAVYEQQNAIQRSLSPFDPTLTTSFNANRSETPATDVLEGAAVRSNLNQFGRAAYNQTFDTGTEFQSVWQSNRTSNNSQFTTFNPAITQSWLAQITQPLMRGRGRQIQRIPFMIAQSRLDQTEEQVRQQILNLIFQAENTYWNAVQQRERLRVQQNNLQLSQAFVDRSRRELELGVISRLDIYQPEQQFATAQVGVTLAQYNLQQAEDAVRRQIGADLDPDFRSVPILLTEKIEPPAFTPTFEPEETVSVALRNRPEVEQRRRLLQIDDLQIKQATNNLRPDVALTASYQSTGRGGNFTDRSITGDSGMGMIIPGGLGDALSQLLDFRFPTYQAGLVINLPLRNRQASANLADAAIQKRRDLYQLRAIEQDIRLDVVQAIAGVEQSKAGVEQATVARDFAQMRLEAEQQKYDLGVTTAFIVLDAQDRLLQSEADLLDQSIAYRRAMLTLYLSTGELLQQRNVSIRYE